MSARLVLFALLWLVACQRPPPTGAAPESSASRPPLALPPVDTSCTSDADCSLFDEELTDDAPRTYACCPGCIDRAANREWLARFRQACQAAPPPLCPPLGCAMPLVGPSCRQGRCLAVQRR